MFKSIKIYIRKHRVEVLILLLIILLAAFLRLYRISDYMTFLGDEGRDAIVAKDILQGHLTLLGPRASAGDFYLGPIYYYMMAPFLFLTHYDPVGPAIMVAIFGIATVFLVYFVGLKFFGRQAALMSAALYSVSPLVIAYSRSSWNPNLMPFFSLLMLYLLFIAVKNKSQKYFILVGFLLGIAMQLHYLSTFLAVIIFFFVLIGNVFVSKKSLITRFLKNYLEIFAGFLIGFSPFLAFEVRHGFQNTRAIFKFIFEGNADKAYLPHASFLANITDVFFRLFARLVMVFPPPEQISHYNKFNITIWQDLTIILAMLSIISLFFIKDKLKILLLSLWLFFGVVLFGIYKKPIYDYYFGFMFPLPFLLIGNFLEVLSGLKRYRRVGIVLVILIFTSLMALNLAYNPFRFEPNKQKDQAKRIANEVLKHTDGKPFNFAYITTGNSDQLFRYFFEVENRKPVVIQNTNIDPNRKSVTSQLMIVCDSDCQPLGNSLWEVAGFGRGEIVGKWYVPFVTIYKLRHYAPPK